MAPKRKETAIERAQRKTCQGAQAFLKVDRDNCLRLLRGYDAVVTAVKNHLVSSRMWVAPTEELPETHAACGPLAKTEALTAVKAEANLAADEEEAEDIQIHRNFHCWGLVPPSHLVAVLAQLEPVSMSRQNMKVLRMKSRRLPEASRLRELHEFCTGVDPSQQVGDNKELQHHVEIHKELNETLGRRARDLQLPPNWSIDGHYILQTGKTTQEVAILKRFTGQVYDLNLDEWNIQDSSKLWVDMNWSEHRALLLSKDDSKVAVRMSSLFETSPAMVKKVMTDGASLRRTASSASLRGPNSEKSPIHTPTKKAQEPPSPTSGGSRDHASSAEAPRKRPRVADELPEPPDDGAEQLLAQPVGLVEDSQVVKQELREMEEAAQGAADSLKFKEDEITMKNPIEEDTTNKEYQQEADVAAGGADSLKSKEDEITMKTPKKPGKGRGLQQGASAEFSFTPPLPPSA